MAAVKVLSSFSSIDDRRAILLEEVELLEAIYINELTVVRDEEGKPTYLKTLLHPATGENVDQQYVCLTLEFIIPSDYPMAVPDIMIKNPRGLADEHINSLRKMLYLLAKEREGGQMLYELIEAAKESLTQCNIPHGNCIICLEDFQSSDIFSKTDCYHYFHSHCLLRYIKHSIAELEEERTEATKHKHMAVEEKQVVCPVCREGINYDLDNLSSTPIPAEDQYCVQLSDEIVQLQQQMAALFEKQKAKGGIIDVEAEKNKYYVTLTAASADSEKESLPANAPTTDSHADDQESAVRPKPIPTTGKGRGDNREYKEAKPEWVPGKEKKLYGGRRDGWKARFQSSSNDKEYYNERPMEKIKPEVAEIKMPEEINMTKNASAMGNSFDESTKSKLSNKPMINDTAKNETKDPSRKGNGGRGRGRAYRSSWGRDEYRRHDFQSKEYGRQGPGNYRRRDGDRMDSRMIRERKACDERNDHGRRQCQRNDEGKQYQRREHERRDKEKVENPGNSRDVSEKKSEEIMTNGNVQFIHGDKSVSAKSSFDYGYNDRVQQTSKSCRHDGKRGGPLAFKSRSFRSGEKQRDSRQEYDDFR